MLINSCIPRCDNLKLCIGLRRTTVTLVVPALSDRNILLDKKTLQVWVLSLNTAAIKRSPCCFLEANEE